MSPISGTSPTAVSVSMPRHHRRPGPLDGLLCDQDIQAVAAGQQHLVVGQVLAEHDLCQRLLKAGLAEPPQMTIGPRLARTRPDESPAQQELADSVAGAHQIAAQILTRRHQVAQRLELARRDHHRPKLSRRGKPLELQRVARVGLDPVTRLTRNRTRSANHHLNARLTRARAQTPSAQPHRPRAPPREATAATRSPSSTTPATAPSTPHPTPAAPQPQQSLARARQAQQNRYVQTRRRSLPIDAVTSPRHTMRGSVDDLSPRVSMDAGPYCLGRPSCRISRALRHRGRRRAPRLPSRMAAVRVITTTCRPAGILPSRPIVRAVSRLAATPAAMVIRR